MVDIEKINELKSRHDTNHWQDDPFFFDECTDPFMEAIGEDEEDALSFIEGSDADMCEFLAMFAEELCDKFQSDAMNDAIDTYLLSRNE